MEDEAAFMYFNSIAQGFLNKTKYNIENKLYKDALSNLYKAEEWRDYFIVVDPQSKKSSFAKEIQKELAIELKYPNAASSSIQDL